MTKPETVDEVIAALRSLCGPHGHFCPMVNLDNAGTFDIGCGCHTAARLTAALERERATTVSLLQEAHFKWTVDRTALLKVAEEMDEGSWAHINLKVADWAAELRRIAGGEKPYAPGGGLNLDATEPPEPGYMTHSGPFPKVGDAFPLLPEPPRKKGKHD